MFITLIKISVRESYFIIPYIPFQRTYSFLLVSSEQISISMPYGIYALLHSYQMHTCLSVFGVENSSISGLETRNLLVNASLFCPYSKIHCQGKRQLLEFEINESYGYIGVRVVAVVGKF